MEASGWFSRLGNILLKTGARSAVKYLSPTLVVQGTRICYEGKFPRSVIDMRFTIGRPNYLARRFIKACKRAGEPFPVKKVQLRFPKARS